MTDDEIYDLYINELVRSIPYFEPNETGFKKAIKLSLHEVWLNGFTTGLNAETENQ